LSCSGVCFHSDIRIIVVFVIFALDEWPKLAVLTFFVVLVVPAVIRPVLLLVRSIGSPSLSEGGGGEAALLIQAPLRFVMVTHKLHMMVLSHLHHVMMVGICPIEVVLILVASWLVESRSCHGCLLSLHACLIILWGPATFTLGRREGTYPVLAANLLPDGVVQALPEHSAALTIRIATLLIAGRYHPRLPARPLLLFGLRRREPQPSLPRLRLLLIVTRVRLPLPRLLLHYINYN
jgi:hypothetical protein